MSSSQLNDVSSIETPEQIQLDLTVAGIGSRAIAYLIDFLWQSVLIVIAFVTAFAIPFLGKADLFVEKDANHQPRITLFFFAFVALVISLVNFGYFIFFELI